MDGERKRQSLFSGPSEMHARVSALDWARTPLGAVDGWPQSLKAVVRTLLSSRYPMVLTWGPELTQIYNDAYARIIADKHPAALGIDIRVTLAEAWDTLGPMIAKVMQTGVANWTPALRLLLERSGYREEAYFSVSHAPSEDDAGRIVGMLAVCSEVTQQVLGERRMRLLRDLASQAGETRSVRTTCRELAAAIGEHPLEVPFALLYLREPESGTLTLGAAVGLPEDGPASPAQVELGREGKGASAGEGDATGGEATGGEATGDEWPLARAFAGETVLVEDVERRLSMRGGAFDDPVRSALVMPIASSGRSAPLGVLVAGVSPNRALDEGYSSFYELLVGQVSVALRNARAYEDERRRAEALAALDRAKTAFFSSISHELRTPLTLILGPVEDALGQPERALAGEALGMVHRSAVRLLRLVNTLLDFSRIEAGRLDVTFEPTNLAALTADLASSFRSLVEGAGLRLTVDCPPLPEPVYVDRAQWEKIVLNLVSNAFKFTLRGEIAVSLRWRGDRVELAVRDTGTGIPAAALPRVFERFYRVRGARGRSFEGTGIGLALVQELAVLHGGSVRAESVEEQGSTFVVSIPTGSAHLPDDRISPGRERTGPIASATPYVLEASQWAASSGEPRACAPDGVIDDVTADESAQSARRPSERGRILVADDNADMRDYLARLLRSRYAVEAVGDGVEALAAARERAPELVLCDVMMPGIDGFELLRALRADARTRMIPVVLLSARAGEEAVLEGLEVGADDYLVKPFSSRELLTRVRTHLEMARVRRGAAEAADSRRWVESILDLMPTPLLLVEPGSARVTFAFANKAADRLAGGELRELLKSEPDELRQRVEVYTYRDGRREPGGEMPWARAARGERLDEVEMDLRTEAGSCSLLVSSDMLPAMHNHPATAVLVFQDVTRLKRTEAELQRAVEAREAFLTIASHELKTPLTPLQLQISALERRAGDLARDDAAAEWLLARVEMIRRQGCRLDRLVHELLDVTRITRARVRLDLELVSLPEVVREAVARLEESGTTARSGSRIDLRLEGEVIGRWDRLRTEQIVTNLLENALKFGLGHPVEVAAFADAEAATLAVTDAGIGIRPEDRERIFGRFERAVPERHYGGLGLGLWVVRRIVDEMGGSIEVRSEVGRGATFVVRLPLAGPADAPPPAET